MVAVMKLTNLTNEQLDKAVALAQGWKWNEGIEGKLSGWFNPKLNATLVSSYHPSTNGGQAMELVKKMEHFLLSKQSTARFMVLYTNDADFVLADTLERAICMAVVASEYSEDELEEILKGGDA